MMKMMKMMKNFFIAFGAACILTAFLSSCGILHIFSGVDVAGEGDVVTREYTGTDFRYLHVSDICVKKGTAYYPVELYVTAEGEQTITVTAQESLFSHITVTTDNGCLRIAGKNNENYVTDKIVIRISGYSFDNVQLSTCKGEFDGNCVGQNANISLSGASHIAFTALAGESAYFGLSGASFLETPSVTFRSIQAEISGASRFSADQCVSGTAVFGLSGASMLETNGDIGDLKATLSGASRLTADRLNTKKIKLDLSGASICRMSGEGGIADITASGGSVYRGTDNRLSIATCDASGASVLSLYVTESLTVSASGGSAIDYRGDCVLYRKEISGASVITEN